MRRPSSPLVRYGLFLALLLAGLPVVAQDYEAQFVKGVKASDRESWQEAVSYFRAAIGTRPHESSELVHFSGIRTKPYLPHYYLGEAYAGSGNCVAALEEFAVSERQGAIQQTGEYTNLLKQRARCHRPTPTAVTIVVPQGPIPLLTPAQNAAVILPKAVNTRIDGPRQLLAQAASTPSIPTGAPTPRANLQRLVQPVVVPPSLMEAASAYFAGDYARAVKTLAAAPDFPDRRAAAQARLFRSAARFALYIVGGAKDDGLQQSALRDASDCRDLYPGVFPRPAVFSPRFVEFFNKAPKTAKPAS